jgi:spore coat protein U-like protein
MRRPQGGTQGGTELLYNLYTNAARSVIWGDGVTGASVPLRVGRNGRVESRTVYARIPPRQPAAPGSYLDTVVVTFTY